VYIDAWEYEGLPSQKGTRTHARGCGQRGVTQIRLMGSKPGRQAGRERKIIQYMLECGILGHMFRFQDNK
jgi:hypothetical protein